MWDGEGDRWGMGGLTEDVRTPTAFPTNIVKHRKKGGNEGESWC